MANSPLLALLLAVGWIAAFLAAWSFAAGQRMAAENAHLLLLECDRLAGEIQSVRAVPQIIVPASSDARDLVPTLEKLAADTTAGGKLVVSIEPQPSVNVPKSSFSLQSTDIQLQPLPLPELIGLLYALVEREPAVVPTAMSLSPTEAPETGEIRWSCQLVLTRLIDTSITGLPSPPSRSSR